MEAQSSKVEAQSSKVEAQSSKAEAKSSKVEAENLKREAQSLKREVQNSKLDLPRLKDQISQLEKQISKLEKTPPFSLDVALDIMLQIAHGMDYVHQRNVVHRDLKSSNILLREANNGKEFHVKVADFGLSQIMPKPSSECLEEPFNTGTLKWMAPEVMKLGNMPTSTYDPFKSDIYSFGIVCFEILSGDVPTFKEPIQSDISTKPRLAEAGVLNLDESKSPFGVLEEKADKNEELMRSVLAGFRPRLPADPTCPRKLKALIESCWGQDAGARPSFAKVIVELKDVLLDSMQN